MPDIRPYTIAVLCYLFDEAGRVLLLHRHKPPNQHLYSPVGGKLDRDGGESPSACALREIREETGLTLEASDLHLTGLVSERDYLSSGHWLMFLYEVTKPVTVEKLSFEEGQLGWHDAGSIDDLPIPETDRVVIWPLFWRYRRKFFCAHIDCDQGRLAWRIEQPAKDC